MDDHDDDALRRFGPELGDTWNADSRRRSDAEGRPSRRFLETSAAKVLAGTPDPLATARLAAALAEAHDVSTPVQPAAVLERDGPTGRRSFVAAVGLENAAESTLVRVTLARDHMSPEAAIDLACALLTHAAAARATQDLAKGFVSLSDDDDPGPPREPAVLREDR